MTYKTDQERFWAGEFCEDYIKRNDSQSLVESNIAFFRDIVRSTIGVESIIELGCNIGLNLIALKALNNKFNITGIEINEIAASQAQSLMIADVHRGSIVDEIEFGKTFDLVFTKTVLIHINPDELAGVYDKMYKLSNKYILVCEYYSPTPVTVTYRGNTEKLFKRDFCGDLMDKFDLKLVNYGFAYHRDNYHKQDDINWFLLEK